MRHEMMLRFETDGAAISTIGEWLFVPDETGAPTWRSSDGLGLDLDVIGPKPGGWRDAVEGDTSPETGALAPGLYGRRVTASGTAQVAATWDTRWHANLYVAAGHPDRDALLAAAEPYAITPEPSTPWRRMA